MQLALEGNLGRLEFKQKEISKTINQHAAAPVQGGQLKARKTIVIVDLQIVGKSLIRRFVFCYDGIFVRKRSGQGQDHLVVTVGGMETLCQNHKENKQPKQNKRKEKKNKTK